MQLPPKGLAYKNQTKKEKKRVKILNSWRIYLFRKNKYMERDKY